MSSDCSDDDMPELESVSSSEYMTDEDEGDSVDEVKSTATATAASTSPKWVDPKGEHYKIAKRWLEQDRTSIDRQLNVITVYLLSPFLYGHAHQEDIWLKWCQEAGLLMSDTDYNTGCLSDNERSSVDLLDSALLFCRNTMVDRRSPESLAVLLKLASVVQKEKKEGSFRHAVRAARGCSWFTLMINDFKFNSKPGTTTMSHFPIELGCLYVINQTADHVSRYVKDSHDFHREFQDKVLSDEEVGEPLKKSGDDMVNANKHREAIEEYSTAIVCCPYKIKLYTNRALAYMELKDYKSSLSDGLRAMFLDPAFPKGYIRYIVALKACGESELMQRVSDQYHKKFTSPQNRDLLKKAIDIFPEKVEVSQENKVSYEMLKEVCKQASESYLKGNIGESVFYFEEAQCLLKKGKGWKNCLSSLEGKKFTVSIHFAYGLSLLENGSHKAAELALKQFQYILEEYRNMHFVPAHWGAARALVLLHRHSHALLTARNGLEQLPLVKLPPNFTWPGTSKIMSEALLQNIEANLQKIQQSCEPACVPDAVCRYGNCTQHHKSSNIKIVSEEYRGHVFLTCSQSCSIAYHPTCWRRFKNESVINSDRDFLLTSCPTPDCAGEVDSVSVFDLKGKCKIKFEPPANKALASGQSANHLTKKKTRKATKSKGSRKKLPSDDASDGGIEEASKNVMRTDSGSSEGGLKDDTKGSPSPVEEDARKLEDTVEIINRRQKIEVDSKVDSKDSGRMKAKKKKEKKTLGVEQLGFEFQVRSDISAEEEAQNKVPKWVPDEEYPFQPPEHLREAIEHFESSAVLGLVVPRPPLPPQTVDKNENEYIHSWFREVFKSHGGLLPNDQKLIDALNLLPEDKKGLIDKAGGLENFLLMSPQFKSHGELICLIEDSRVIAASIDSVASSSGSGLSPDSDAGKNTKKIKTSKKIEKNGHSQSSTEGELSKFVVTDKTKVYGEELSSGGNSSSNSPLISPRVLSPVMPTKTRSRPSSASSTRSSTGDSGKSDHPPSKSGKGKKSKNEEKIKIVEHKDKESKERLGLAKQPSITTTKHSTAKKVNGIKTGSSEEKLMSEWNRQVEKVKSELVTGGGRKESWGEQKPVLPVNLVSVAVDVRPLVMDKWVMTDQIAPVENFKDRFEIVLKEKTDLQVKLEGSEDQRFKMQRDHKRELERVQKQSKAEAKEEYQCKISELERKVSNERERVGTEKKDHTEQSRSLKTEIKSLSDKIEKMKKEAGKKERQSEGSLVHTRAELERVSSDKRRLEDRLSAQSEAHQVALRRAVDAELELLSLRRDTVLRPAEMHLREVDRIIMNVPKENEYFHEWENYKGKLRTSLDCFVNAVQDQEKHIRGGKLLSALDPVPNPAVPFPQALASFRMPFRPPFMPMMVRPPVVPMDQPMTRPPIHVPPTGPNPPGALAQPAAVGGPAALPLSVGPAVGSGLFNDLSPGASLPTEIDGLGSRKVSSFNRIVEKLAPSYPQCSKSDFKAVLREVRRNNGNTLSGLSLDNIATQIISILDTRAGKTPASLPATPTSPGPGKILAAGGVVVSGKGKRRQMSKGHPATARKMLPPVAVADPPIKMSEIEYDNDGWCIICYEDMYEEDSSTLNCGHRFHSECIRSWFNEQSTCPTCRNHSLLPDEYPTLT